MNVNWSERHIKEAELFFSTDLKNGLTDKYVNKNKQMYGKNDIDSEFLRKNNFYGMETKKSNISAIFSRSVDLVSVVFAVILILFYLLKFDTESYVLIFFLVLEIVFVTVQGLLTEHRFLNIYNKSRPKILVVRNGKRKKIFIEEIVPGDVIILSKGDIVPADAKIIFSNNLSALENFFGEQNIHVKNPDDVQNNIVYASSTIMEGNAECIVTATGEKCRCHHSDSFLKEKADSDYFRSQIEVGRQAKSDAVAQLKRKKKEKNKSEKEQNEKEKSVVQESARKISSSLTLLKITLAIVIIIIGISSGKNIVNITVLTFCMATAIMSECIPLLIDYGIIYIMEKLSKHGVFVKHPSAIDKINETDVIIVERTDTFSHKKIALDNIYYNYWNYKIELKNSPQIGHIVTYMALCCNVDVVKKNNTSHYSGSPIDTAVYSAMETLGLTAAAIEQTYKKLEKSVYDTASGLRITLIMHDKKFYTVCLGDAENIIDRCKRRFYDKKYLVNDANNKNILREKVKKFYEKYDIVFAVAIKECTNRTAFNVNNSAYTYDMDFLGIINFSNSAHSKQSLHSEVAMSLSQLKNADIETVVICEGSNNIAVTQFAKKYNIKNTHMEEFRSNIAYMDDTLDMDVKIKKLRGIFRNSNDAENVQIVTGKDLDNMNDVILFSCIDKIRIFSGLHPNHKLRILRTLKLKNKSVAVTAKELTEHSLIKESSVSFASTASESSIVANHASVTAKSLSVSNLLAVIKSAAVIYTNIKNMLTLMISSCLVQYMIFFVVLIFGGTSNKSSSLSSGSVHILWFSFGVSLVFSFALINQTKTDNWAAKRKKIKTSIKNQEATVLSVKEIVSASFAMIATLIISLISLAVFMPAFQIEAPASQKSVSGYIVSFCFALISSIKELFDNSPQFIVTSMFVTMFSCVVFFTISISQNGFLLNPAILKNKAFAVGIVINTFIFAIILIIPSLGKHIGFEIISVQSFVVSVVLGIIPAICNELGKITEKRKREKEKI